MSELIQYKCLCCGGALTFNSDTQKMLCSYCDTEFEVEALKKYDEQLKEEEEKLLTWDFQTGRTWEEGETDNMRVYACQSCGGEVIADETTGASECPYCNNPVVMKGQFSGKLKPDLIIPFKYNKEAAKSGLKKHLVGKRFLPKVFKDENHIDEIKGIYVPFWLFNAEVDADVRSKAVKTKKWEDPLFRYSVSEHYSITRGGNMKFENVPIDGSKQIDNELMESIEPFDFNQAVDFQTAYLSGYLADKYDVPAEENVARVTERVRKSVEDSFKYVAQGYEVIIPEHTRIRSIKNEMKYALCPVWILNTTWNGQKFTFAMNGQTGKFVGNLPFNKKSYYKWYFLISSILSIIGIALGYLYVFSEV